MHKFLTSFLCYFIFCSLYIVSCGRISYFGRTPYAQLQGDLSGMRLFDVSFYHSVRLPEGAIGIQGPGIFWKGFCRKMRYEAKKSRQGKRYPASCRATCVVRGQPPSPCGLWRAKEVSSLSGRSSKSEA